MPLLLAIESSCDETAAAIIDSDLTVHSNVVASQTELHQRFGGVVPEIASRAHLERILPVIDEALLNAKCALSDLSAIAVASEPGLVGSLLVGLTAAKTLSAVLSIPLITINHIEAHIYACRMAAARDIFPATGFVVSGGHSNLYNCRSPLDFELLGATIDDAAGEAFDKVAHLLGLNYPGGPAIQNLADQGNPEAFTFPRPLMNEQRLDFSFSGLKTAVLYTINGIPGSQKPVPQMTHQRKADIAASFQQAVIDVLVTKCSQALDKTRHSVLCVGGGVAANRPFRERLQSLSDEKNVELVLAPLELCTDNAAMAGLAWEAYRANQFAALDCDVIPGLVRLPR